MTEILTELNMMKKQRFVSLFVLTILCLFLFCSCSGERKANVSVFENGSEKAKPVSAEKNDEAVHSSFEPLDKLLRVSRTDMTILYFDKKSFCVCVYDASSKKLWRALPEKAGKEKASSLSLTVLCGGNEYVLNSQDDCVSLGAAEYKAENDSLTVTYRFKKELQKGSSVDVSLPVLFTCTDGMLTVSVDMKEVANASDENVKLKTLELLNYFSADADGEDGDYIFVPDGSGAVLDVSKKVKSFESLSLPVYGADPASNESSLLSASVAAFGRKSGNCAFVALVEDGDAISTIRAEKALTGGGFNRVYASFDLTKTSKEEGKTFVSNKTYNGKISVSYRFLSDDNADYIGMASACRELLIRSGVLRINERTVDKTEGLPFELSLIGSAVVPVNEKKTKTAQLPLTTFDEAKDIISFLRSKGIKNINLKFRGLFEGGLVQNSLSSPKLFSPLGGKQSAEELTSFAQNQNISVFAEVNLVSSAKANGKTAIALDKTEAQTDLELLKSGFLSSGAAISFSAGEKLVKNSDKMLAALRKLSFDGISVADCGKLLYSDNSLSSPLDRTETKELLSKQCAAVSSGKKLAVSGSNIYALKYADLASGIESSAFSSKDENYTSVPFLQAVLHGYTDYSLSPINAEKNPETAFLKAVEYGAVPCFEWYYADLSKDGEKKDELYYANSVDDARQYYERMNAVFSDLRDKKITKHYKVKSKVYCTEYNSSTGIYVNYSKKDVTVNGVTVEARSFVRVN